jgi:hypothetical protein
MLRASACLQEPPLQNTVLIQIEERARQLSEIESEKIKSHSEDEIEKEVQRTLEKLLRIKTVFRSSIWH